jgi:hypothetical protein
MNPQPSSPMWHVFASLLQRESSRFVAEEPTPRSCRCRLQNLIALLMAYEQAIADLTEDDKERRRRMLQSKLTPIIRIHREGHLQ